MAFHEDWYRDEQLGSLVRLARLTRPLAGSVVEFGCWEGKSTCALAVAMHPDVVIAVDTWQGNLDESASHETVRLASERDVFSTFSSNVSRLTQGNVETVKEDCHRFMERFQGDVKFCHVDACHDYESVKRSILAVLPHLVVGGTVCGDDYLFAHLGREDLAGGVERAVCECLPGHRSIGNLWYWVRGPR